MTRVLARDVLRSAAVVFNVPLEELVGRRRDFATSRPRNLTCRAIRTLCPHVSYPEIGRMLGDRDHTTIVKNVARTEELLETVPALAEAYERLLGRACSPEAVQLDEDIAEATARLAALTERRAALLTPTRPTQEPDHDCPADC